MSSFDVKVHPITKLENHPDADRLELATILGYRCVVGKGIHAQGDLIVYIPEDAIVPDSLLKLLNLEGKLAGKQKNRVKAVRLRGILSQGIVIPLATVTELLGRVPVQGEDVAEGLGIVKWDPPIPLQLQGIQKSRPGWFSTYTDLEHLRKFPNVFEDGEFVVITEKLHGACMAVGYHIHDGFQVSSRNVNLIESESNSYWRAARLYDLEEQAKNLLHIATIATGRTCTSIVLYGELLGVQDLKYGFDSDVGFRFFDIKIDGEYISYLDPLFHITNLYIESVPVLYTGPYSMKVVNEHVSGPSTIANHIREGIVIRPEEERHDPDIGGRVLMKAVSEEYLTRRGGTEYK